MPWLTSRTLLEWHLYHGITGENKNSHTDFLTLLFSLEKCIFPTTLLYSTVSTIRSPQVSRKKKTNKCTKNRAKSPCFEMIWRMWNGNWSLRGTSINSFFGLVHEHIQPKVRSVPRQVRPISVPSSFSCPLLTTARTRYLLANHGFVKYL